jgi:hypothetical protein
VIDQPLEVIRVESGPPAQRACRAATLEPCAINRQTVGRLHLVGRRSWRRSYLRCGQIGRESVEYITEYVVQA